jgi:glyoxylase-like metal-dependent hydrolase (beta-lactamase superfamily II)
MTFSAEIITLDLNFQNCKNAIASYLIPYQDGIILIESGPGSTQIQLQKNLNNLGYDLQEITHVLLTHIHLDHAGAAGWLSGYGAHIFVHERGAPHLLDPSRLIASATRIYQDQMNILWGDFLPVPKGQLTSLTDGDEISIGSYNFRILDTPGHANHHLAYLLDDICFSGDVGGVRISDLGPRHLRVPMPPPEFHPSKWRKSIERLKNERISKIAPTHFGLYDDVDWHLDAVLQELDAAEEWMNKTLPLDLPATELREDFVKWARTRSIALGVNEVILDSFEKANPSGMSADGIKRYWEKYINPDSNSQ